ncbi:hypothetical protein HT031_004043 [Scenedesmus sp. PABB004]|nr:hypothetical protein HT031_004043 [Scenedesmus sp. PABB004]
MAGTGRSLALALVLLALCSSAAPSRAAAAPGAPHHALAVTDAPPSRRLASSQRLVDECARRRHLRAGEAGGDGIVVGGSGVAAGDAAGGGSSSSSGSILQLAADLASVAARLAGHAAAGGDGGAPPALGALLRRRHMRPHRAAAAVEGVSAGLVKSRAIDFKGHTLTVVAMSNDEYVGAHILAQGTPFQAELLGQLMDFISPGSTVVDAGANFGSFSIFFAAAAGPTGRVFSFEPQARMFQLLCTNMMVNGLLHIAPKNVALSYGPGELAMSATVPDGTHVGKSYTELDGKTTINYGGMHLGAGGEPVRAIALDSLNLTGVSLIKVDVQGAEKLMFYGARDTIKRNKPVVAFETNADFMADAVAKTLSVPPEVLAFSIADYLKSLGYTQPPALEPYVRGGDAIWVPPGHPWLSTPAAAGSGGAAGRRRRLRRWGAWGGGGGGGGAR